MTVRWKDVPTNATSNPTAVQLNCGSSGTTNRAVFVSSISDKTPGPLTVNGTATGMSYALPFGDNSPLTLKVPLVEMPQSNSNSVYLAALTYDWIIPGGWIYSDGTVSDGSTRHRFSGSPQAGNQISVTPAPGTGGAIQVRAVNNNCISGPSGPDNSISQTLYVDVSRPAPTLTILSDKSPSGGNFTLNCGDQSDYHFRYTTGPVPSGGSFSGPVFTFSGPITPGGQVASATPATNFTGVPGQVGVSLQAQYTRNGATTTVNAPGVTVTVQSSLASPVFINLPAHLCDGQSTTLRVFPVPNAQQYTWTLPPQILTSSATPTTSGGFVYVTTSPRLPVTAHVPPATFNGRVTVKVAAGSSICGSSEKEGSLIVGPAESITLASPSQADPNQPYYVCADQPIQFSIIINNLQSDYTDYSWTVNGSAYPSNASSITLYSPPAGQSLQVVGTLNSNCGNFTRGVNVISQNSIGGQPCEIALPSGPPSPDAGKPETLAAAYPNPADGYLNLRSVGGSATLYDSQGQPVRQARAEGGRLRLDTRALPAGLYHVVGRNDAGRPVRLSVQVAH